VSNLTPAQVVDTLSKIGRDIDETTETIGILDEEVVRARAAFKKEYARRFLTTEGSMDVRRYTAELETADLSLELELTEVKHRAAVQHLRALRDRLEIGRSISALVRLEWGVS
jgi:ABC-type Na+ transport system ATPase subunit NatA